MTARLPLLATACSLATAIVAQPAPDTPEPEPIRVDAVIADDEPHLVGRNGGTYWVRVPRRLRAETQFRVLLCLHGLDSNGWNFQHALASLGLGERAILLCPNGERRGPWRHAHRFDPEPVLAALDDLATKFRPEQVYLIGHSQGAWLGYRVLLHAPERFSGALLAAGGLAGGAEPVRAVDAHGDALPPLLIVHGGADPVVSPQQSDRAYEKFLRAGWPALRYWHPDDLDHDFGRVPLAEGLTWLQELTPPDATGALKQAALCIPQDRIADAAYLLARADRLGAKDVQLRPLQSRLDQRAARLAKLWLGRIDADREPFGAGWYDERAGLARLPAFAAVVAKFETAAAAQEERGRELAEQARAAEQRGDLAGARRLHEEITKRCSAAFELAAASRRWLARR